MATTIPVENDVSPTQLGGGRKKKSNGHKSACGCPICKNMRNGKKGNGNNNITKGGKKKNGHKAICGCPICINMKHAKGTKKRRGGSGSGSDSGISGPNVGEPGDPSTDDLIAKGPNDPAEISENIQKEVKDANNAVENIEDDEAGNDDTEEGVVEEVVEVDETDGGRKRKKKGNGHKPTCGCPICKNMRKGKKGGEGVVVEATKNEYDSLVGGRKTKRRRRKSKRCKKQTKRRK